MSAGLTDLDLHSLPREIPIFPLPGVLLLPGAQLPLNIFEPRYLNMVEAALASRSRLIGMVQTRTDPGHPVPDSTPVYDVGCAGRITAFQEADDGRYLVTLTGLIRFRILDDAVTEAGYRAARADYARFAEDLQEDDGRIADRRRLLETLEAYFKLKGVDADWNAIEDASDEAIVTSLSMMCPFEAREKQVLLETDGIEGRAELLATLMEIAIYGDPEEANGPRH